MKSRNYWFIIGLCFSIVLGLVWTYPIAQDSTGIVGFESQFTKIGLQYRFDNGWADQFSGKIIPINNSALKIEWYRYDDELGFLNETFHNPNADRYEFFLSFYLDTLNNTGKTTGIFYIEWFKYGNSLEYSQTSGSLVIRDNTRSPRAWTEIIKARKYQYTVGDLI